MVYSTCSSIDILVPKLIWWLALYGLSVQVSCIMFFPVHGIVPPSCCMYFLGLRPQKCIQPSQGTNQYTTITCSLALANFRGADTRIFLYTACIQPYFLENYFPVYSTLKAMCLESKRTLKESYSNGGYKNTVKAQSKR